MLLLLFISCQMEKIVETDDNSSNTNSSAFESFSFAIPVTEQRLISLDGVNSEITVLGMSELDTIKIWGEKIVNSESEADAAAHLKDVAVVLTQTASGIFVETEQPAESNGRTYLVKYNLLLPKHWPMQIGNVNGTIEIDSLESSVSIGQVNGEIYLREFVGSANVQLTNGQIDVRMTLPNNGQCRLSGVNILINLTIPRETSATFYAGLVNGTVSVTNLDMHNLQSASNYVNGVLGSGQGSINLQTVNGCIEVAGF